MLFNAVACLFNVGRERDVALDEILPSPQLPLYCHFLWYPLWCPCSLRRCLWHRTTPASASPARGQAICFLPYSKPPPSGSPFSCIPLGFIYGQYTGLRRLCQVMLVKIYVKSAPNVVFVVRNDVNCGYLDRFPALLPMIRSCCVRTTGAVIAEKTCADTGTRLPGAYQAVSLADSPAETVRRLHFWSSGALPPRLAYSR